MNSDNLFITTDPCSITSETTTNGKACINQTHSTRAASQTHRLTTSVVDESTVHELDLQDLRHVTDGQRDADRTTGNHAATEVFVSSSVEVPQRVVQGVLVRLAYPVVQVGVCRVGEDDEAARLEQQRPDVPPAVARGGLVEVEDGVAAEVDRRYHRMEERAVTVRLR